MKNKDALAEYLQKRLCLKNKGYIYQILLDFEESTEK